MPVGAVGAIVGARRARLSRQGALAVHHRGLLHPQRNVLADAPYIKVYDQRDPLVKHKVCVPFALRKGAERSGKLTETQVLTWLGRSLGRNVTLVVPLNQMCSGVPDHDQQFVPFDEEVAQRHGSPFTHGARVVVCCDGAGVDAAVASQVQTKDKHRNTATQWVGKIKTFLRGCYGTNTSSMRAHD